MKIRTDFVTNSSSSCYILQIIAEDDQDQLYVLEADGSEAESYGSADEDAIYPQVTASAETLAKAKKLQELHELLIKKQRHFKEKIAEMD